MLFCCPARRKLCSKISFKLNSNLKYLKTIKLWHHLKLKHTYRLNGFGKDTTFTITQQLLINVFTFQDFGDVGLQCPCSVSDYEILISDFAIRKVLYNLLDKN